MGTIFVGGNLALDYVGTLNERFSTRVENLVEPADLGRWLVAAGIVDAAPAVSADGLARAIVLREAIFAVVAREIDQQAPRMTPAEVQIVNGAAAVAPPVPTIAAVGRVTHHGDLDAGLSAVARDSIALFERTDDSVLKWCADQDCTHPFLDRSRGHRRRWCEMSGCGDRAKAAAYRARQRSPTGGGRAPGEPS